MEKVDIQQPTIRIEIPAGAAFSTEATDGYYKMREWQVRCFDMLRDSQNWIINAPMAAGKSFQICAIAADRLSRDKNLKVIIAVPQTIIAAGFRLNKLELPDSTRVDWSVAPDHDLCRQTLRKSSAQLLKFLQGGSNEMMSRVILCTHATLVRAFTKNKVAFKNVLLVVDEAHHIRHGGDDAFDVEVENRMGALVKHALQNPELIRLGLTTATFFRGDKAPIIPDPSRFTRFEFAYDKYLASCKYLRSFSYSFVIHSSSFVNPLTRLFDQRIGKTLVYIPSVNSYGSVGSKVEDVNAVLKAIAGTDTPVVTDEDQPITRVKRGETWVRVVNLVDTSLREQKKEAIVSAHDKPHADDIDVIIALGMFKEGANWRWADREIIIGQRGSLTEVIQMVGRLFRDVAGKSQVEVYQLLPFAFDQTDKASVRERLNKYLKALLLSMLLENVMDPVLLPSRKGIGKSEGTPRINYLREVFPDHSEAVVVL
jgi:superfamily II DNA or RNA helicase